MRTRREIGKWFACLILHHHQKKFAWEMGFELVSYALKNRALIHCATEPTETRAFNCTHLSVLMNILFSAKWCCWICLYTNTQFQALWLWRFRNARLLLLADAMVLIAAYCCLLLQPRRGSEHVSRDVTCPHGHSPFVLSTPAQFSNGARDGQNLVSDRAKCNHYEILKTDMAIADGQ